MTYESRRLIQSSVLPFNSSFDLRPRNTRIERRQIKALLTNAAWSFSGKEDRQVRNAVRRKAEQIRHRRALITDNQGTPKDLNEIVPRPDFDWPMKTKQFILVVCVALLPETLAFAAGAVRKAVREADEQWSKAAAAKDLGKTVSFYADDAVVLPPNQAAVTTKVAFEIC